MDIPYVVSIPGCCSSQQLQQQRETGVTWTPLATQKHHTGGPLVTKCSMVSWARAPSFWSKFCVRKPCWFSHWASVPWLNEVGTSPASAML